jgi:nitrogenase molybdenum-iron protein alpha chain
MGLLEERKVISREKRTNAINAYYGFNDTLKDDLSVSEIRQRIRTFSQSNRDEITEALNLLSTIKDAVVIIHGAIGCSAALIGYQQEHGEYNSWYSTDLNERDTIMGGDEKLRKTVERAYHRHKPKAIFVVGTPVVAINNDDINSVILELEEELNVRIISIYVDGFKSKAWINGYDIVLHGLAKYIVKNPTKDIDKKDTDTKEDFINLISVSENQKSILEIKRLLNQLNLNVNVIPRFSSIKDIEKAGLARASIALDYDEADVLLEGLKEKAGVPYIKVSAPIGISATTHWLTELGKLLSIEDKVEVIVQEEEKRLEKYIYSHPLKGARVYVDLNTQKAIAFVELIHELGGELAGITLSHVDDLNKVELNKIEKGVNVRIGDGQPFEIANILSKNKVDYYIGDSGKVGWLALIKVLPISVENKIVYGYEGVVQFIQAIKRAKRSSKFNEYIADNAWNPYKESWLGKSTNWYIKQEVK